MEEISPMHWKLSFSTFRKSELLYSLWTPKRRWCKEEKNHRIDDGAAVSQNTMWPFIRMWRCICFILMSKDRFGENNAADSRPWSVCEIRCIHVWVCVYMCESRNMHMFIFICVYGFSMHTPLYMMYGIFWGVFIAQILIFSRKWIREGQAGAGGRVKKEYENVTLSPYILFAFFSHKHGLLY